MPDCTFDTLEGLHNVPLEMTAPFWYCDPTLWESTFTWDRWQHNCQIIPHEGAPCRMIALWVVLWTHVSYLFRYSTWNTYTPPLDRCPAFWYLLKNVHIGMVITEPWPLRVIWHIQPCIHHCVFLVVTKFLKQSTESLVLSWWCRHPCHRTTAQS